MCKIIIHSIVLSLCQEHDHHLWDLIWIKTAVLWTELSMILRTYTSLSQDLESKNQNHWIICHSYVLDELKSANFQILYK